MTFRTWHDMTYHVVKNANYFINKDFWYLNLRNYGLLSFGDEAECDEDEASTAKKVWFSLSAFEK